VVLCSWNMGEGKDRATAKASQACERALDERAVEHRCICLTESLWRLVHRPDQPSSSFPSVSYNIVNNTVNVETMNHSPVQQGGVHSAQHQTVTYNQNDLADLNQLVAELTAHLGELPLEPAQRRKADAQVATLKAQLADDPDPVIIGQAGRTLRNVTEGAIGSLLATAVAQPNVWTWVGELMRRLFI
jgi:hypothetical protein